MHKFGPLLFAFAIVADVVALGAFLIAGGYDTVEVWQPLAVGGVLVSLPFVIGAGWLSILWGARDTSSLAVMGIALLAHLILLAALAYITSMTVMAWMIFLTLVIDVLATFYSYRVVTRQHAY